MPDQSALEKATFAAGCFWHVELEFGMIPGVVATQVGYCGGKTGNPTYDDVCSQLTGHAEAVEVTFDPAVVTYETLLHHFWGMHDPTQLNRQGPDVGTNYRSAIFWHSDGQRVIAEASRADEDASGRHRRPIVTEIQPVSTFWKAEEYHQQYLAKRCGKGCHP